MLSAAPDVPLDQAAVLATLRARVARLEGGGRAQHDANAIPVCEGLPLPAGGLARAAVHEVLATSPGSGAAFCAMLLARTGGTVLWIAAGQDGLLAWPPGLARCGLAPANLVLVRAERWSDALWAMEEALRCPAVTGALLALDSNPAVGDDRLDLTATPAATGRRDRRGARPAAAARCRQYRTQRCRHPLAGRLARRRAGAGGSPLAAGAAPGPRRQAGRPLGGDLACRHRAAGPR